MQTTLRASTPIIFAALAAVLTQNAGILNVGIEGGMLISALTAVCANAATGSWVVGVLASIAAAELYSLVIAVAHLRFKANVFAVGSILNIMAASLTGFILNTASVCPGVWFRIPSSPSRRCTSPSRPEAH